MKMAIHIFKKKTEIEHSVLKLTIFSFLDDGAKKRED